MNMVLLSQILIAPVIILIIAAFSKRWAIVPIVIGFWLVVLSIKGLTLQAMDSVAIALTASALLIALRSKLNHITVAIISFIFFALLSIWQVKNFAGSLTIMSWVIQFLFLLLAVVWPTLTKQTHDTSDSWLSQLNFAGLLWIIPIGYTAILSPIAGSLVIGQVSGLLALLTLGLWIIRLKGNISMNTIAMLVAVPVVFISQMAWHYAEISWTSLALGYLAWLPLLWRGIYRQPWYVQLAIVIVCFAFVMSAGLYLEWPEESLY